MDSGGHLYSAEAVAALKQQSAEHPKDLPLKRKLKSMLLLSSAEHADLSAMTIRQRQGWAKARNERKRARQGR